MNHLPSNIGQSIQVQLRPSGDDFDPANHNHNFHSYPAVAGWNYDERESTLVINKKFTGVPIPFDAFLQSWLFFGLIATVARTDQPFKATDFTEKGIGNYVHTKTLNEHLKKWKESELSKKDGLFDRMIRAEAALVKARRVVLKYCSYDTEKELPWSHPYFIDSEIALSLMVLGETLAAAKEKIVKQADLPHIRGWYGDANEGWGTPRCIIKRMKDDKWCKRTVQTLRGQLRNHATSFLAAWPPTNKRTSTSGVMSSAPKTSVIPSQRMKARNTRPNITIFIARDPIAVSWGQKYKILSTFSITTTFHSSHLKYQDKVKRYPSMMSKLSTICHTQLMPRSPISGRMATEMRPRMSCGNANFGSFTNFFKMGN